MGTSNSSLLTNQRKQAEILRAKQPDPEFFKLVDDRGKGELVDLAKVALRSGDNEALDAAIKQKITKYLYNGGKGKQVFKFFYTYLMLESKEPVTKINLLNKIIT